MKEYCIIDMAIEHLERAISIYTEEGESLLVITLSGIADEILGKYVKSKGKTPRYNHL